MKLKITITMDNADGNHEAGEIWNLRDINGNHCGQAKITR